MNVRIEAAVGRDLLEPTPARAPRAADARPAERPPRASPPRAAPQPRAPARGRRARAGARLTSRSLARETRLSCSRAARLRKLSKSAASRCTSSRYSSRLASASREARHRVPRARARGDWTPLFELRRRDSSRSVIGYEVFASLVDDLVLGVLDDLVLVRPAVACPGGCLLGLNALVDGLRQLVRGLRERVGPGLDLGRVVALQRRSQPQHPLLDRRDRLLVDRVTMVGERLLGRVEQRLAVVLRVGELAHPVCLVGVRLGVVHHPLDLVVVEARAALDADLLLVARTEVLRRDVDDPVRVDVEGDFDLRQPPWRRRDADELELAQGLVERRHLATRPGERGSRPRAGCPRPS